MRRSAYKLRQDLESQQSAASKAATGPGYARVGRGGAGNFRESSAVANSAAAEAEQMRAALASAGKSKSGLTGRGGVGNWSDKKSQGAEVDKKRKDDLEAKIVHDVEEGLALPPRIYRQHERDSV